MLISRDIIFDETSFPGMSMAGKGEPIETINVQSLWPGEPQFQDDEDESQSPDAPEQPLPVPEQPPDAPDQTPDEPTLPPNAPDPPENDPVQQPVHRNIIHIPPRPQQNDPHPPGNSSTGCMRVTANQTRTSSRLYQPTGHAT